MLLAALIPIVHCATPPLPSVAVPYFKETIELWPDRDRIAVLTDGASAAEVASALGLELVAGPDAPALPNGWAMLRRASAPSAEDGPADLPTERLAAARRQLGVRFVSPVLRDVPSSGEEGTGWDARDAWRIATPELIVQFEPAVPRGEAEALLLAMGGADATILGHDAFGLPNAFRMRLGTIDGMVALALARTIAAMESVRFAEPDMLMSAWPASNDPLLPSQWAIENTAQPPTPCGSAQGTMDVDLDVDAAWTTTTGDPTLIVLVIDNGVQFNHPDLLADPGLGFDATPDNGGGWPMNTCDDHGTPVAGIIAALADNGIGTAGIAPSIRVAAARIAKGNSNCLVWTVQPSWVAAGLEFGLDIGARITNTSWTFLPSAVIEAAYANADSQGVLHVVSAGNGGTAQLSFPASLSSVLAVSAITSLGAKASFSNYGEGLDLTAPGVNVLSTDRTRGEGYSFGDTTCFGGTSAASPCVAGVAALVLSTNPTLTNGMVRTILRRTTKDLGEPGYDVLYGWGLPRAGLAVAAAMSPGDLDLDGDVDPLDLAVLLAAWGSPNPVGDIDGSGVVDTADLGMLLAEWD